MFLGILGIAAAFSILEYYSIKQLVNKRESYWKKVREENNLYYYQKT